MSKGSGALGRHCAALRFAVDRREGASDN